MTRPDIKDVEEIRRLVAEAGGVDEFIRWVRLSCRKRPGRPKGSSPYNDIDAAIIEAAKAAAARTPGLSLHQAIRTNVILAGGPALGASADAAVERLMSKTRLNP